ncbi:MAG: hypothetical protein M1819_002109 [Sarea resinae]|nr:MAG: hypothetical protein M1819_002109 [Sarea resinae]
MAHQGKQRDDVSTRESTEVKHDISKSNAAVTTFDEHDGSSSKDGERQRTREYAKAPWWSYIWDYEPGRSHEERKFVQKLDVFLISMLSFGYFIKNLDQTNISNAFVSGMKEDLKMNGNQLNLVDTAWTVGYVIGQFPSQIVLTKVRPSIWIPCSELVWTMLTFCLASAKTSNHVIAIRFFVGLAESVFYPAAHTILGAWYKPSELAKRACIFHSSSAAASMFSGYLQAGVYKGLNGRGGLAGWKWLFIMDGVISIPITLAGFFLLPDLPENTRAFYLNATDREMGRNRMESVKRAPRRGLGRSVWKRVFGRWHVYVLTVLYITFINAGPSGSVNPMALWLKSEGESTYKVNVIPTSQYAVQLVSTVTFAILSDFLKNRTGVMLFSVGLNISPSSSIANEICSADAEERALVLGSMNTMGYAFNAWVPLLTFPQDQEPMFRKGWIFCCACFVLGEGGSVAAVWYFLARDRRRKVAGVEDAGVLEVEGEEIGMRREVGDGVSFGVVRDGDGVDEVGVEEDGRDRKGGKDV